MIKIKSLTKKYNDMYALNGVDLNFHSSQVNGLLGPNGCGKTTLIKSILGLVIPQQGEIFLGDKTINEIPRYRGLIGYMPQNSYFPGNITSGELLKMVETLREQKAILKDELIELFGIGSILNKPTSQLSGGTRQKVSATMAFMFDPQVLILDEPTVGLDPVAGVQLKKLIAQSAQKGKTVILVTHMVAEIEQLVQKMFFMLNGKIILSGTLDEIREQAGTSIFDEALVKLMQTKYQKLGVDQQ